MLAGRCRHGGRIEAANFCPSKCTIAAPGTHFAATTLPLRLKKKKKKQQQKNKHWKQICSDKIKYEVKKETKQPKSYLFFRECKACSKSTAAGAICGVLYSFMSALLQCCRGKVDFVSAKPSFFSSGSHRSKVVVAECMFATADRLAALNLHFSLTNTCSCSSRNLMTTACHTSGVVVSTSARNPHKHASRE